MKNNEKVFAVEFECNNCGYKWKEEFYRGDRVTQCWDGVRIQDHRCTGKRSCPYCRIVRCPICDVEKDVKILDRKPLL